MPVRLDAPDGPDYDIYRTFAHGDLLRFHVLDTRQYRADQMQAQCSPAERDPESDYCPVQLDESRSMLGAAQRDWLFEGLKATPARGWNVLANQVGFAAQAYHPQPNVRGFFVDSWDGYVADRQEVLKVLKVLKDNGLANTVVITGDKHEDSVRNVAESYTDLAGTPITTEFVGTSISSEGDTPARTTHGGDPLNPHILLENFQRGYVHVELNQQIWRSDFRVVATVREPDTDKVDASTLESWIVENGHPGALPATGQPSAAV